MRVLGWVLSGGLAQSSPGPSEATVLTLCAPVMARERANSRDVTDPGARRRRPAVRICWLAPHLACPWLQPNSDSEAWTSPRASKLLAASWGSGEDVETVTAEPDADLLPSQPFRWLLLSPQVLNIGVQWGPAPRRLLGLGVFCLQIHTCTDPSTLRLQARAPEPQTVLCLPQTHCLPWAPNKPLRSTCRKTDLPSDTIPACNLPHLS